MFVPQGSTHTPIAAAPGLPLEGAFGTINWNRCRMSALSIYCSGPADAWQEEVTTV
jgi:hypothetical protein